MELGRTESLCPECLARIPARRVLRGDEVFLVKDCPRHGSFETPVWRGAPEFEAWQRPKTPAMPPYVGKDADQGCPFDCGLCPDHRQRTCTLVVEVTQRCDLGCPVCYANSPKGKRPDPAPAELAPMLELARQGAGDCNIQLSGGEPTMRDDLPELVRAARRAGFGFVQINTNGLRLAAEEAYLKELKSAGLDSVFLQFDGAGDQAYLKMRGRALFAEKMKAVDMCGRHGVGVVLVPTLAPGVNESQVGPILKLAVEKSPVVRAVHFQPISYFGRHPFAADGMPRLTLPEIMRACQEQTGGMFKVEHFRPPGCENARCSFHGNFLIHPGGEIQALGQQSGPCCGGAPESAEQGALRTIARVSRQWALPPDAKSRAACACSGPLSPQGPGPGPVSLDDFLARARSHTLSVSAMAFQDAWSLDLERVRDCCIHVLGPEGGLIPFCLYNITSNSGRSLYRP